MIIALDLEFQGKSGVIAAYLLPHTRGAALIETGPGSTQATLIRRLSDHGYNPSDITDVFLTHIHLDHAGASGWLARHGARIHVHPVGAPHLLDPSRLLASAARIYGDHMDSLWGEFLPVPPERLTTVLDGEWIEINGLRILPLDTPGHARHHMAYLYEDICFSGDIGGVRLCGLPALRVPMPPPEFHLEDWRHSLSKLSSHPISAIAPTHFGIYRDPGWHLANMTKLLDEVETWMSVHFLQNPPLEELKTRFASWLDSKADSDQLDDWTRQAYELANPSFMSIEGMQRYWRKIRNQV